MIRRTILARLIIAVIFIFSTIIYQLRYTPYSLSPNLVALYGLFTLIVIANLFYLYLNRKGISEKKNLYIQFTLDAVFITALILISGGTESPFSFLYLILIVTGSMFLYRKGGYYLAGISTIFYGGLLDLQYFGIIFPYFFFGENMLLTGIDLMYKIFLHTVAFFMTAFLSTQLSEQLRKAREELKEKRINIKEIERISRAIPSALPSGVLVVSEKGEVIYANETAEKILKVSLPQMYMEDIKLYSPFDLSSGFRKELKVKIKGEERILGYSVLKMEEEKKLIIFQDLTEVKRKEREMQLNERLISLGKMVSVLAHEIRNPLEAIGGAAEFVKEKVTSPEEKRMCDIIVKEVFRLEELLKEFIEFSRIRLGSKKKIDLNQEVRDVLSLFAFQEDKINVKIEIQTENAFVMGDADKVRECLINVVKNAIESMQDGGSLHVKVFEEGDYVHVVVKDTGQGMSDEVLSRAFEPFFTTKHSGSGLGLSVVYRIMELHNGKVKIESEEGKGTSVQLSFPKS